ncbi:peptide ABC transporter substrate-binding protein [Elstera cyanobacteriorum]|uniref:4-phytase n=1 Tax=Elstera cyanobacteriorum TaxID=2022747 RepID=A0A255XRB5_9PROT|nr:ABC transporter substrate-binding protein [Elstera cyanobacteriorum]OYQ19452.1 4-phytase [Elstera cyanobacteriorum]GFZ91548.1 peptide ABC transporter substrate-binding protein [Elstera cyanobacteriorum]
MRMLSRAALLSAATILSAALPALAQDAVFAVTAREVGAPSYNPITGTRLNSANSLIFDRLLLQDADQSFHGLLAQSWDSTPDGMIWTFKLKPGVKFHDGEPFNAKVIDWWIPKFAGTENAYMVEAIDKVEIVDDLTFRFLMKKPDPNLLFNLASSFMGVPSPKAYDALGDKFGVTAATGTGPFKMEKFTVGQETVLVRNEDYKWGSDLSQNRGPAKLKKITVREIADDSTAFLELKTGGVDFLYTVPTDFLPRLKQEAALKVMVIPGTEVVYMPINTSVEPFTDIKLRAAAAYAINQKDIWTALYGGIGKPANGFLISGLEEAKIDPKFAIAYDPARSKKLLDEAGWVPGPDGIRAKGGQKLQVKLWTTNGTEFKRISEAVQAQLKAVGILADITLFDASTINAQYKKKTEHQLAIRSYSWTNADIIDWFFSGKRLGYPNVSMLNDPKAEELNDTAMNKSRTWNERVKNFIAYHEYVLSQYAFAPIYEPANVFTYSAKKLKLPEVVRGTRVTSQTILDAEPVK